MEITKKLKGKKGLTLIELLAVLVIVGIIAAIAVPAIGGTISKSKDRADRATVLVVKDAAMRFATDRMGETSPPTSVIVSSTAAANDDLVDLGYLNATPTYNSEAKYKVDSVNIVTDTTTGKITLTLVGGSEVNK